MALSASEDQSTLRKENVRFLRLMFTDIQGHN